MRQFLKYSVKLTILNVNDRVGIIRNEFLFLWILRGFMYRLDAKKRNLRN